MSRKRLRDRRSARIVMFEHDNRIYRATFACLDDGGLGEIFLDVGKANAAIQVHADDSAVLVSLLLQHGVSAAVIRRSISGPISVALQMWLCGEVEE
jgi:hypothetical protein